MSEWKNGQSEHGVALLPENPKAHCCKLDFHTLLHSEINSNRFEVSHVHKVECVVPWLNDTLVFFTISLQLCQQLKDKVCVYRNIKADSWTNYVIII